MGCGQQPGIPCALALKEGDNEMQTSGVSCRGNDGACLDIVIASEVKQSMSELAEGWIASSLRSSQ